MERIKQALEKARLERESMGTSQSTITPRALPPQPVESGITYSQTKVIQLDPDVLRRNRIIFDEKDRIGLTAYKMLRTQVLQRMVAREWNAVAITSPGPEDGKTLTAINLAISLARELNYTVLLVDLDLRNPSIHRYFGIEPSFGIDDVLLRKADLSDALINPGIDRLVILPGRQPIEDSSELLSSPFMGAMVSELKNRYPSRFVLFDLPPILSLDDALAFSPFVDAFLLVVCEGKTTRDELEHALELLKDVKILGSVLNKSEDRISTYY